MPSSGQRVHEAYGFRDLKAVVEHSQQALSVHKALCIRIAIVVADPGATSSQLVRKQTSGDATRWMV